MEIALLLTHNRVHKIQLDIIFGDNVDGTLSCNNSTKYNIWSIIQWTYFTAETYQKLRVSCKAREQNLGHYC